MDILCGVLETFSPLFSRIIQQEVKESIDVVSSAIKNWRKIFSRQVDHFEWSSFPETYRNILQEMIGFRWSFAFLTSSPVRLSRQTADSLFPVGSRPDRSSRQTNIQCDFLVAFFFFFCERKIKMGFLQPIKK